MSNTIHHDFKGTIISAELKKIVLHALYKKFSELLAAANLKLMSTCILTEQALAGNFLMHPIIVTYSKKPKDSYYCIGGIRSLLLAQSSLALDQVLSVILLDRPQLEELKLMVNSDILLLPLLTSIRNPTTIGAIHQQLSKEEIDSLLKSGMHSKSRFAEEMGFAKNTIFPPKSNSLGKVNAS